MVVSNSSALDAIDFQQGLKQHESGGNIVGMRNPYLGQKVRADGLDGTFTVFRTDTFQAVVDIESTDGTRRIERGVPFSAIRPVGIDLTTAVRRKVGEAD
jgi:hypothetical protein